MFEGNLGQPTGFIAIGALYFTNGYCTPEPATAAKRGEDHNIIIIWESKQEGVGFPCATSYKILFTLD